MLPGNLEQPVVCGSRISQPSSGISQPGSKICGATVVLAYSYGCARIYVRHICEGTPVLGSATSPSENSLEAYVSCKVSSKVKNSVVTSVVKSKKSEVKSVVRSSENSQEAFTYSSQSTHILYYEDTYRVV